MTYPRRGPAAAAIHPGEILNKEFLKPLGLSGYALARATGVTPQRISDILLKKHGVSAEMAVRLARYFGTTPEFWMNLQMAFELSTTGKLLKKQVARIKPLKGAA